MRVSDAEDVVVAIAAIVLLGAAAVADVLGWLP